MLNKFLVIALCLFSFSGLGAQQGDSELQTVSKVDLNKFMGTWYEIARLRFPWDSYCAHNSQSVYSKTSDTSFDVVSQCQTGKTSSDVQKSHGIGRVTDSQTNAKMNLSFNYFNKYGWAYSGDYWIIQLADDYSYAVVSEPTQKHVMILSRTPQLSSDLYQSILDKVVLQLPNINVLNMLQTLQD